MYPIYVRSDLAWEAVELEHLHQYLRRVRLLYANVAELIVLHEPAADLYGPHWSTTGRGVPDDTSPDEAVYLPGRNVLLSAKALLWCHLHGVESLALGVLASNPFPDASTEFFALLPFGVDYLSVTQAGTGGFLGEESAFLASTLLELGTYVGRDVFVVVTLRPPTGESGAANPIGGVRAEWAIDRDWTLEMFHEDRLLRSRVFIAQDLAGRAIGVFFVREWAY